MTSSLSYLAQRMTIFCCLVSGQKQRQSLQMSLLPAVELSISSSLKQSGQNFIYYKRKASTSEMERIWLFWYGGVNIIHHLEMAILGLMRMASILSSQIFHLSITSTLSDDWSQFVLNTQLFLPVILFLEPITILLAPSTRFFSPSIRLLQSFIDCLANSSRQTSQSLARRQSSCLSACEASLARQSFSLLRRVQTWVERTRLTGNFCRKIVSLEANEMAKNIRQTSRMDI